MTKEQKARQKEVAEAMVYTGDEPIADDMRANIYVISSKVDDKSELKRLLMKLIYDDNIGGMNDLSYEIVAKACDLIAQDDDITDGSEDIYYENESASVYTADRLGYLNATNQEEITQKMKEFGCDIQTACAVWYDDMVRSAALTLRDYILGGDIAEIDHDIKEEAKNK